MSLTLDQLLPDQDRTKWLGKLLLGAQGVSSVAKPSGLGSGTLALTGASQVIASLVVNITTAGELGAAAFTVSTDGGGTFTSPATIPGSGTVVLAGTGVSLQFSTGPSGGGTSFVIGDSFTADLTTPNLPVSQWQAGSTALTLLEVFADAAAELGRTVKAIAKGGFARTAVGPWLDLVALNVYNLTRNPGIVSHRTLRITDTGGVGPVTLTAGELWVGTPGGLRWTNTAGGSVPLNASLDLDFAAEQVGALYNVGAGAITTFFTSFPGLTVSDPGGVATITTAGQDTEGDPSLLTRCISRWPSLGVSTPNENYDLWAKTASGNVTRTKVRPSPTVPGQVELYLAGAAGAVDGATVAAVNAYVQMRLGTCISALVQSAAAVSLNITATVYCFTGYAAAVSKAIAQNLAGLVGGGTDTFGELLPPVPIGGTLYLNQIIEQLQTPIGVRNVVVSVPSADTVLTATQVLGPGAYTITITEVSS